MERPRSARVRAPTLQHALLALIAVLCAASLFVLFTTDSTMEWPFSNFRGNRQLTALVYGAVGYLVTIRRPRLAVGWVVFSLAVVDAASALTREMGFRALQPGADVPGGGLATWLGYLISLGSPILTSVAASVFPDGPLRARRWRIALGAVVALGIASLALGMLVPAPVLGGFVSPIAIGALAPLVAVRVRLIDLLALAAGALGVGSLVARYGGATTMVRQQIKWVMAAGVLAVLLQAAVSVDFEIIVGTQGGFNFLSLIYIAQLVVGTLLIPAALGIAILRYRLFDIDLIINRALVYGGVSAILAGAFAGLSTAAQYILRSMTGQQSEIVSIALAVLATAAFTPLKTRVQAIVDRHLKENSGRPVRESLVATR